MQSDAVATALAVAREQGLDSDDPVVLREAWHVLVHLRPHGIVARVSTTIPYPQGPDPEDVVRELDVAAHAARAGAAVIPPADGLDPGPHRHGGRIVTFWRYVEEQGERDARAAGRRLREIHETLADYDGPLGPAGHPDDLAAMLDALEPSDDVDLLREVAAAAPRVEGQALHGDAHLGNCLPSAAGPLWHDFECACRGAREYDLAALMLRDRAHGGYPPAREALAAYGGHDDELVDALLPLYAAWVYASMLIALPRRADLADTPFRERLDWLRANAFRGSA
ncbi:MAG: phosphotransferase [Gaiellaceae bacterium]